VWQGYDIGKSLVEEDLIQTAKDFLEKAKAANVKVVLPRDFVVAPDLAPESANKAVHVSGGAWLVLGWDVLWGGWSLSSCVVPLAPGLPRRACGCGRAGACEVWGHGTGV
jgi:hypothetical protein